MKKLLCCGGRKYDDVNCVDRTLSAYLDRNDKFFLIVGGATGADQLCKEWAKARGLPVAIVHANWDFYGNSAGPIRNDWMLVLMPDDVIAFPGHTGTADMMRKAKRAGILVWEAN